MKIRLEKITHQEFFNKVWSQEFTQRVQEIAEIPGEIMRNLKDPNAVGIYTLQINQHQAGLIDLLDRIDARVDEGKVSAILEKAAKQSVKSHVESFIKLLVKQCQDNLYNQLQMKYGRTQEVINDKATKITAENIDHFLAENEIVVLKFWASWCSPCMAIMPVVNQLAQQYEGKIAIGKVNIDEHENLVKTYKVASIPTLLFIKKSKVETTLVGLHSLEVLQNHVNRLLETDASKK